MSLLLTLIILYKPYSLILMNDTELLHLLALLKVEGVGDIIAKKLLNHCGSAQNVFTLKTSRLKAIEGVGQNLVNNLKDASVFEKATAELHYIKSHNIQTCFYQEAHYPERLKHCIDGPVLLFYSGAINWNSRKVISIVGTRQVTPHGADFCRKLIEELAPLDPIIISGFAYGVDIVAHQAAIDNQLQTIGILAHGLNQIYPKTHKKYMSKMEQNGGFMTEFWSSSNPERENFVRRNRIVAGISEATIVIESAEKGGSLITANMANEYNRDVFAVPGRTTDRLSQGCNNLIKTQRAHLLSSAADLMYILNWDVAKGSDLKPLQKQLFVELDQDEQKIYDYLLQNGKQLLDVIAIECEFPVFRISTLLLNMELKGVIRPLPGKLFEAV